MLIVPLALALPFHLFLEVIMTKASCYRCIALATSREGLSVHCCGYHTIKEDSFEGLCGKQALTKHPQEELDKFNQQFGIIMHKLEL